MPNPLRDLINRQKWLHGDLENMTVTVRHRGAPNDEAFIHGAELADILPDGIVVRDDADGTFIPFHRILRVRSPQENWDREVSDES